MICLHTLSCLQHIRVWTGESVWLVQTQLFLLQCSDFSFKSFISLYSVVWHNANQIQNIQIDSTMKSQFHVLWVRLLNSSHYKHSQWSCTPAWAAGQGYCLLHHWLMPDYDGSPAERWMNSRCMSRCSRDRRHLGNHHWKTEEERASGRGRGLLINNNHITAATDKLPIVHWVDAMLLCQL